MKKPAGAQTVEEYLARIEQPRRGDVEAVHAMIRKAVPRLEPAMVAGMIGYGSYRRRNASGRECDWPIVAMASNKSYISVYTCAAENGEYVAERSKALLPKASIGRCCIRFKRLADIDLKALGKVVKESVRVIGKAAKTAG